MHLKIVFMQKITGHTELTLFPLPDMKKAAPKGPP